MLVLHYITLCCIALYRSEAHQTLDERLRRPDRRQEPHVSGAHLPGLDSLSGISRIRFIRYSN